jgi:hypothetical protein
MAGYHLGNLFAAEYGLDPGTSFCTLKPNFAPGKGLDIKRYTYLL